MKGLLIKDLMLLKRQKTTLIFIIIFVIFLAAKFPWGAMGYVSIFMTMLAVNSISYDEFDNGYAFLFTLPVSARIYVTEKYLYVFAASFTGCFFSGIAARLCGGLNNPGENILSVVAVWLAMLMIAAILIPLQLKFGVERSRIMGMLIGGTVGGAGFAAHSIGKSFGGNRTTPIRLETGQFVLLLGIVAILGVTVSFLFSLRIMENKEF